MCVVSKRPEFKTLTVIPLTSPSTPPVKFHSLVSRVPEVADSAVAGVGVALNELAEAAPFDWIRRAK